MKDDYFDIKELLDSPYDYMRDATKEEQEKVNGYINSISEDTGVNFWDILDENYELNRIADEFNKIGCTSFNRLSFAEKEWEAITKQENK